MATVELVRQGATREGYSLLVFAEGDGARRRFWWTCGGCWSRSDQAQPAVYVQDDLGPYEPSDEVQDLMSEADDHVIWCSVHR